MTAILVIYMGSVALTAAPYPGVPLEIGRMPVEQCREISLQMGEVRKMVNDPRFYLVGECRWEDGSGSRVYGDSLPGDK